MQGHSPGSTHKHMLSEAQYVARHMAKLEDALSLACSDLFCDQPEDPLTYLAQRLLLQATRTSEPSRVTEALVKSEVSNTGKWTAKAWISSLGAETAVVSALLGDGDDKSDELLAMRSLSAKLGSPSELAEHLRRGRIESRLAEQLYPAMVKLAEVGPAHANDLQSKFAGAIEMSYAGLDTFYGGVCRRPLSPASPCTRALVSGPLNVYRRHAYAARGSHRRAPSSRP